MIFREVPFQYEMTTADGRRMGEGRSVGVHLSDVIRFMRERYKREQLGGAGGEDYMMAGFLFEVMIEDQTSVGLRRYFGLQRAVIVGQQETQVDGIYITPDGLNISDGYYEEYKASWKSQTKWGDIENEFWHWLVQIKANCYAAGTNLGRLIVWFLNGNYKPYARPSPPVCGEFEFTDEELEENWEMVKRVRDEMLEARGEAAA